MRPAEISKTSADLILVNGKFYTMVDILSVAKSLLRVQNRIYFQLLSATPFWM